MNIVDAALNRITMYRLLVYGLGLLSAMGFWLSLSGRLSMAPMAMLLSLALLCLSTLSTEWVFARIWRIAFNAESWLITALIIFLIFPAPKSVMDAVVTVMVGVIASASKYLISWRGAHIFNPAALAVTVSLLLGLQTATWWVGTSAMWPFALFLGLLVVRKTRKLTLFVTFAITCLALQFVIFIKDGAPIKEGMSSAIFASPLIFLGTIMLTEPATMPSGKWQQLFFGALVAGLYTKGDIGPLVIYPEVALLVGNAFAAIVSPKFKIGLRLQEIQKISDQVYNYVFKPDKSFAFTPGQYMEWTLPHVQFDGRGNRRAFTIASSPTETTVQIGIKFYPTSSTFKYALSRMQPGEYIYGSQLSGSFTLEDSKNEKLAFIAGGIGITPFRSMVKYLVDMQTKRDISIIYLINSAQELAYAELWKEAKHFGVNVILVVADKTNTDPKPLHGFLTKQIIEQAIPDFDQRLFYVSGPNTMVDLAVDILRSMNVSGSRIKRDYFSGY